MADEIVPEGSEYDFPEAYLNRLEEYETNGSEYKIVQGALYDWLKKDCRPSATEATNVSQLLNRGEVEEARELVNKVLEDAA